MLACQIIETSSTMEEACYGNNLHSDKAVCEAIVIMRLAEVSKPRSSKHMFEESTMLDV